MAGIGATVLACLVLSLQVDSVSTQAGRWLTSALSGPDLKLSVGRVEGSWIRSLRVTDLRVSSFPGDSHWEAGTDTARTGSGSPSPPVGPGWQVSADSLEVGYRLLPLLSRRVSLTQVEGHGVRVRVHLGPPDTSGAAQDDAPSPSEEGQGWRVSGEWVELREGALTLRQLEVPHGAASTDSTRLPQGEAREPDEWALDRISLLARQVEIGGGFSLQVDSLQGRLLPSAEGGPEGRILAVGGYGAAGLRLDTLLFSTQRSHMEAAGRIPIPLPLPPEEGLDLNLSAQPLHLHDLRPFLPDFLPDTLQLRAQAQASSSGGATTLDLRVHTSGAGRLEVESTLSGRGADTGSQALLQVRGLDLALLGIGDPGREVDLTLEAWADSLSGPWEGNWGGETPGVSLEGRGSMTFGTRPRWELDGEGYWRAQSGAPAIPALDSTGMAFSLQGSGEGTSPGSMTASGRVRMDSGSFGRGLARDLSLRAHVEDGRGELTLTGVVGDGPLQGTGALSLAVLPELRGEVDLGLREAKIRGVSLDSAAVAVDARGRSLIFGGGLVLEDSATARWHGTAELPAGGAQRVVLDSLSFAGLNPRSMMAFPDSSPLPPARLSGKLRGEGMISGGAWEAEASLQLDTSRIGGEPMERALLEGRAHPGGGSLTLDMVAGRGGATGEVRVEAWEPRLEVLVPEIRFQNLDVGSLMDREGETTRVTGRVQGEFAGGEPSDMTGELSVALDSAMVLGRSLSGGTLEARLREGRATARLDLLAGGTRLEAEAEAGVADSPIPYRLQGHVTEEGDDRILSADFGLEGEGINPDSLDARGWFRTDTARWRDVVLESGRAEFSLARGVLRLDTLALESQAASVSGGGEIPLRSVGSRTGDLRLAGTVHRADMLAGWVGAQILALGEGEFQATASGTVEELALTGEARVTALLMDGTQLQGARADVSIRRSSGQGLADGQGHLTVDRFRTGTFSIRQLEVEGTLGEEGKVLDLTASTVLDGRRDGRLALRVEDVPDSSTIQLRELEFRADEDLWQLRQPSRISFQEGVRLDSLVLEARDQALRLRGRVGSAGPLSLEMEARNFRIGTVSDLVGFPSLQGQVSGSVSLGGTGEEPTADLRIQASLESSSAPPSQLRASARYGDRSLTFDARADVEGERGFRADGALPIHFSLADSSRGLQDSGSLEAQVSADSLPLEWIGLFLPEDQIRNLRGVAGGSLRLTGSPSDPGLEGTLELSDVEAGITALGARFGPGAVGLRFQGDRLNLDSLRLRSGDGTLTGRGTVVFTSLSDPEFDLDMTARSFRAMATSGVHAVVSGDLHLGGTALEPQLSGRAEVLRADLYLEDLTTGSSAEAVSLTEEELRELARVFGYRQPASTGPAPPIFRNASLDLTLDLRRDSWIRQRANPELAVQFSGDLSVQKAPGDSIRLVGQVSAVPQRSYVEQFGRRFSLTQGELVFQGAPMATRVDLSAEYEVPSRDHPGNPEVVIVLAVSGTPQDLSLELSSNPPLEASDMVSYLAVGRPADRSLGGGEGSITETGGALALGRLSGAVESYAREQVGLDVVEITTDGLEGVTLLAGRYVSPDLYLGVRQPVSLQRGSGEASQRNPNPELEVELQALRWLLLNVQAGGRGEVELFVRTRISYE